MAGCPERSGAGLSAGVPPGWGALQGLAGWAWIPVIQGLAGSLAARGHPGPGTTTAINQPTPAAAAPQPPWARAARYANQA